MRQREPRNTTSFGKYSSGGDPLAMLCPIWPVKVLNLSSLPAETIVLPKDKLRNIKSNGKKIRQGTIIIMILTSIFVFWSLYTNISLTGIKQTIIEIFAKAFTFAIITVMTKAKNAFWLKLFKFWTLLWPEFYCTGFLTNCTVNTKKKKRKNIQ